MKVLDIKFEKGGESAAMSINGGYILISKDGDSFSFTGSVLSGEIDCDLVNEAVSMFKFLCNGGE